MYDEVHKLDDQIKQFYNENLALVEGNTDFRRDEIMDIFPITFSNGYEVDFKLVNGNAEAGPYLDVVLFDANGSEIYALDPSFDKIEGKFTFEVDDEVFTVTII